MHRPALRLALRCKSPVMLAAAIALLVAGSAAALGGQTTPVAAPSPPPVRPADDPVDPTTTTAASAPPTTEAPVPAETPPTTAAPEPVREAAAAAPAEAVPAPAPEAAPAPPPPPPPPAALLRLPLGKGMWLHHLDQAGSATAVVNKAKAVGLTHLYLRVGSSKKGFYNQYGLNNLLPVAHAAGIKVVGWDFPYLFDPAADAQRAADEIAYTTPDGHRMDAFSADIETAAEGVNLTPDGAHAYGARLRELVGPDYPLIATVPRPSPKRAFPFAEATDDFNAIAPMVYWQNRDPATDAAQAMADLAPFGKPVLLIGQAYDGGPEGGPAGPPPRDHLDRFMATALSHGAAGVSFWVWHTATAEHWAAIKDARAWRLTPGEPAGRGQVTFLQRVLTVLGQPVAVDGVIGPQTRTALATLQQSLGLPGTGLLDP
ncbi:MAG TPA: peptidoglycan-binding domain-containing protein, partial [Acidimicrobiia bacterium]